ncbi:MAG: hypothetical protein WCA22_18975 [Candidatus Binatus sp.]
MSNKTQPISQVQKFADEAERLGCYSKDQRYNFGTAWAIVLKGLTGTGLTDASTVEQLRPKIAEIFKEHGRQSRAKADSLKAYSGRVMRLLDDFLKYNGGDFMAWKEALAKSPSNDDNGKRRRRKPSRQTSSGGDNTDVMIHRLVVRQGTEAKIELPQDLSEPELESVWAQLTALKGYIKAQIEALEKKPAKTSEKIAPQV